jgi:hypothetical protein
LVIGGLIVVAAATSQPAIRVSSARRFGTDNDQSTIAEVVERPAGITDEGFARSLIKASGLRPWNGKLTESPASAGHMGVKAVHSGSGPEVTVYFVAGDSSKVGRVCRISRKRGGMTEAWTSAQDWCASIFGLPRLKREPPIRTANAPTH